MASNLLRQPNSDGLQPNRDSILIKADRELLTLVTVWSTLLLDAEMGLASFMWQYLAAPHFHQQQRPSMCRGDCVLLQEYNGDAFMDDLATWSLALLSVVSPEWKGLP